MYKINNHIDEKENQRIGALIDYYKRISLIKSFKSIKNNLIEKENHSCFDQYNLLDINTISQIAKNYLLGKFVDNSTAKLEKHDLEFLEGFCPNDSQKLAILNAVNHDLSIIQGPPGTGKTETILSIVYNILHNEKLTKTKKGMDSVAVVSTNAEALNNIIEKLNSNKHLKSCSVMLNEMAYLGSKENRETWSRSHNKYKLNIESKHMPVSDKKRSILKLCSDLIKDNDDSAKEESSIFIQNDEENQILNTKFINYTASFGNAENTDTKIFINKYPFIISTVNSLMKCMPFVNESIPNGNTITRPYRYDYVIIDEASLCDPMLGLLAMCCAEHLVLVGDVCQLAPVYKEDQDKFPCLLSFEGHENYLMKEQNTNDGMSILMSLEKIYRTKIPFTFLNEHYRCHKGIATFLKDSFYNVDNRKLSIKTKQDSFFSKGIKYPFNVLWYEGNYCEKGMHKSKINYRQIDIFLHFEVEYIRKRINESKSDNSYGYSFAVISPYKATILKLQEKFKEYCRYKKIDDFKKLSIDYYDSCSKNKIISDNKTNNNDLSGEDEGIHVLSFSTAHKSQGKEFDTVFYLPIEDNIYKWPYSQGKRLINVVVSRAKQELRIICSSSLMSQEVQEFLKVEYTKPSYDIDAPSDPYLLSVRELIDYIYKHKKSAFKHYLCNKNNYFIYDKIPIIRIKRHQQFQKALKSPFYLDDVNDAETGMEEIRDIYMIAHPMTALEECMYCTLRETCSDLSTKGSTLNLVKNISVESLYIQGDYKDYFSYSDCERCHFDFAIYDVKTLEVYCVIEVDGNYHRVSFENTSKQENLDNMKNKFVEKVFGLRPHEFRFDNTGSFLDGCFCIKSSEVERIRNLINGSKSRNHKVYLNKDKLKYHTGFEYLFRLSDYKFRYKVWKCVFKLLSRDGKLINFSASYFFDMIENSNKRTINKHITSKYLIDNDEINSIIKDNKFLTGLEMYSIIFSCWPYTLWPFNNI